MSDAPTTMRDNLFRTYNEDMRKLVEIPIKNERIKDTITFTNTERGMTIERKLPKNKGNNVNKR